MPITKSMMPMNMLTIMAMKPMNMPSIMFSMIIIMRMIMSRVPVRLPIIVDNAYYYAYEFAHYAYCYDYDKNDLISMPSIMSIMLRILHIHTLRMPPFKPIMMSMLHTSMPMHMFIRSMLMIIVVYCT